ncbi:Diphthamide biosynthesis protein 4 [Saitoella coloradoensis]
MTPAPRSGSRGVVNHYVVLRLPEPPHDEPLSAATIKQAYHVALLRAHPDKKSLASVPEDEDDGVTIDQVITAYEILSSPSLRAAYDASLLSANNPDPTGTPKYHAVIDLDDMTYNAETGSWFYVCRCGEDDGQGYTITEEDLEEGRDVVGCAGCSLWVRVAYEVVED